jgi:hypothetical protein
MEQGLIAEMVVSTLHSEGYRLPSPEGSGIGTRQWPVIVMTGRSWLCHHTVNSPFVRQISTLLS